MATERSEAVRVLARALDQAGDVLTQVHLDQLGQTTPCSDWSVAHLIDHLVADAHNLRAMVEGEQPDWSARQQVRENWAETFREAADDLVHAWHQLRDSETPADPDMATAEFAVHTWDLAQAIGFSLKGLDPEVARRGLEFMRANLTDDNRGEAFGPEQPVPDDAGAYDELAAFAGREP
ncbi:MAG: TIGR03086 family metal-binding protein [Marmoricola sp.]